MLVGRHISRYMGAKIVIEPPLEDKYPIGRVFDQLLKKGIWCELFAVYCPVLNLGPPGMLRLEIFPTDSEKVVGQIDCILEDIPSKYIQVKKETVHS